MSLTDKIGQLAYNEDSILDVSNIVLLKSKSKQYNFYKLPRTAILSISYLAMDKKKRFLCKRLRGLAGRCYLFNKKIMYCSNFGCGAPALISLMEELRYFGVENFIFIGVAGSLNLKKSLSNAFYVDGAYSTSGCSYHYSPQDYLSLRKTKWTNFYLKELSLEKTISLSTDAPFRETKSLISYFEKRNVGHIDMETASLYSFGNYYSLNTLSIVVSADSIKDNIWRPPESMKDVNKAIKRIIKKLLTLKYE